MSAVLSPAWIAQWRILPMQGADLPEVAALERQAYAFPWTVGIFCDCLKAGYSAWTLRDAGGALLAYALMTMAAGEAHVLNLCVEPRCRRQGLARHLMGHLLALARAAQLELVLLEVRSSNRAALGLYEDLGFREIGRRKGYYPSREGREDALVLVLNLRAEGGPEGAVP